MPGVYSLSTTVDIIFILPKLHPKKSTKKQLNFSNSIFCSMRKTATFHHFFHLSFPEVPYKSVLLSIVKVPYKSVLLSIINCRHLSYPDVLYKSVLLSSKNAVLCNLTSLIILKSAFLVCSIMLSFRLACKIKKRIKPNAVN